MTIRVAEASESDKLFTEDLFAALKPIGVKLLDHVVIGYCQLKSNWADFLPRASNPNAEQSMSYEFVLCPIFGQIHLT